MNIGFDASRAFINNRTGTENYSYQLFKNLVQIDQTNKYYIYTRTLDVGGKKLDKEIRNWKLENQTSSFQPQHPTSNIQHPISIHTIPFPRLWTQAGLALQTFKDPLDVLFIPAHTLPLIRKPGLPTVVTVHDLGAEYLPTAHQLKQRLYLDFITHHQLKSATHLIAVSEATKRDLIDKVDIDPRKITVVYEGYNQELFKPLENDAITNSLKYYNLEPKTYFLFVGTIQPRKNLERLIRGYAKFVGATGRSPETCGLTEGRSRPAPTLVLAGSRGWLSDEIYALPKKLGIADQVKFLGYVPDKDLPALYNGALAFLFPSLFEGFGLPVLEAMACGCPVLTSNTSSLPELVTVGNEAWGGGRGGPLFEAERERRTGVKPDRTPSYNNAAILVNPYSEEDISKGIYQLLTDTKLKKRLIEQGFIQVKQFSWKKCAHETLAVLKQAAITTN